MPERDRLMSLGHLIKHRKIAFKTIPMKKIFYFATLFLLLAFNNKETLVNRTTVYIAPESRLMISGTTNVNTFNCEFDIERLQKSIPVHYEKVGEKYIFKKATLVLNNSGFNCGSKGINSDFHELLKSEEYPQILLKLKEIEGNPFNDSPLNATVDIKISGHTNSYTIPVTLAENSPSSVSGKLNLSLGDFKLKAPKKMLGLIVVHDSISIDFDLALQMD